MRYTLKIETHAADSFATGRLELDGKKLCNIEAATEAELRKLAADSGWIISEGEKVPYVHKLVGFALAACGYSDKQWSASFLNENVTCPECLAVEIKRLRVESKEIAEAK